jgi:hypothetical protein
MQDASLYGISSSVLLKQARSVVYCKAGGEHSVGCREEGRRGVRKRANVVRVLLSSSPFFFQSDEAGVLGV